MSYDLLDRETQLQLQAAGVQMPERRYEAAPADAEQLDVEPLLEGIGGKPADPDSLFAAFGHWAEDSPTAGASRDPEPGWTMERDASNGVAHPPFDVRDVTTEELRAYYRAQIADDPDNARAHYEHMQQDLHARMAYEATGVHETWEQTKLQAPAVLASAGLAEAFPVAAWYVGMAQTESENEAAAAAMFYPMARGARASHEATQAVKTRGRGPSSRWGRGPGEAAPTGTGALESTDEVATVASSTSSTAGKGAREGWTKSKAGGLIDSSEGAPGPGKNVGHSRAHIPQKGQDAKTLAESRPTKSKTTVYRNERHAQQDLRDVLNDYADEIDNLPVGGIFEKTAPTKRPRQGFNSAKGAPATEITFEKVTVVVTRMPDGRLHIIHFSPNM